MSKHLFLLLWLIALGAPVFAHDKEESPRSRNAGVIAEGVRIEQRLNGQIPLDVVFTDETGRRTALSRYFDGKPVLLALVYYDCPQLCPLVLDGLARSLRPLDFKAGEDYRVVAVSIDPGETPELAAAKKRVVMGHSHPEAATGWHLLTGSQLSIETLAEAVGFRYRENEPGKEDRYLHAIGAMVITPAGKISRYFYGFDYPPRDLRFSLLEASGNRIGSPVDQLLLFCYKYDPAQGRYTLAILNILRLSGVATALGLGGFLLMLNRRSRKTARRAESQGRMP
jgi:protein SCO1/2